MLRKIVFSILLIGFLFNIFHDFVFYKIDPCMKTVESLLIDKDQDLSLDPLCNIHKNFHMYYIFVEKLDFIDTPVISITFPIPKNLFFKPLKIEIFKPPN